MDKDKIAKTFENLLGKDSDGGKCEFKKRTAYGKYEVLDDKTLNDNSNRLQSGKLRNQFTVFKDPINWNSSTDKGKSNFYKDQIIFVQVKDDIWDVYQGDAPNPPVQIVSNVKGLQELLKCQIWRLLSLTKVSSNSLQQIYYGAPGTGKSHEIKERTKDQRVIRTTFHPDSDYSTFVGAYKPITDTGKITYKFVRQAFLKAYLAAWKKFQDSKKFYVTINTGSGGSAGTSYTITSVEGDKLQIKDDKFVPKEIEKKDIQSFKKDFTEELSKEEKILSRINNHIKSYTSDFDKGWELLKHEVEFKTCPDPQFLIIEEINRGNCAQIFGDLFQLLDRGENGFSEYPIEADTDIQQAIKEAFATDYLLSSDFNIDNVVNDYISNYDKTLSEDVREGRVMLLPPNLYIWATMNTSDQSLFPIDSAFKRRWEWKYIKITNAYQKDEKGNFILNAKNEKIPLNWKLSIEHDVVDTTGSKTKEKYDWWLFLQKINDIIASMTSSADKQLGYFFCKADTDGIISEETFVSKVLFYLWNDVFKDYGFDDASLFRYKETIDGKETEKDLTFPDFYNEDGDEVNTERVADFVQKVMDWNKDKEDKK